MIKKMRKLLAFSGATILLLSACGGDGESVNAGDVMNLPGLSVYGLGGEPASQIFNPWLVSIRTFRLASVEFGTGDIRVGTLRYSDTNTVQDHIDFYVNTLSELDTCEVFTDDDGSSGGSSDDSNVPYVSGGQEVVINTPSGPWYTIPQNDVGRYEVDDDLPGAIPAGATLSIPGDVFPTVAAFPITEPPVPVRISPAGDELSAEDEYRWQPSGQGDTYMRITILEYDQNGNFVDFRAGCNVFDDGVFDLPADVRLVISESSNSFQARYTRRSRRLDLVDGIVVYSRISVAE